MDHKEQTHKFPLRVIPWFTDGCSTFLQNLFKWLPKLVGERLLVLEFGGGNSTFFFLTPIGWNQRDMIGFRVENKNLNSLFVK
jgi:hypothetical protein